MALRLLVGGEKYSSAMALFGTLLAGQFVETEEDVAVVFRLSNPPIPEK